MRVYIASSFRHLHAVLMLRDLLQEDGYKVVDWTEKALPLPEGLSAAERRIAFDTDTRGLIYIFCAGACGAFGGENAVDAVIYYGPAGQDAACEIGMASASGIPTFGLAGHLEEPGLILTSAVACWCKDVCDLREKLRLCAANRKTSPFPAPARETGNSLMPGECYTNTAAAQYLKVGQGTLRRWRVVGQGPQYTKLKNGRIVYEKKALDAYKASCIVGTSYPVSAIEE